MSLVMCRRVSSFLLNLAPIVCLLTIPVLDLLSPGGFFTVTLEDTDLDLNGSAPDLLDGNASVWGTSGV